MPLQIPGIYVGASPTMIAVFKNRDLIKTQKALNEMVGR